MPLPFVTTAPGLMVNVHEPEGNPVNSTDPVELAIELDLIQDANQDEIKDWPTTNEFIADSLFIGAPFEQPQPIHRLNPQYFRFSKNQYYHVNPK